MRVAVYTIAKDEEKNVVDWYQSASQADVICVADTGSTDRTLPLLQAKGGLINLNRISIEPWRYDDAHNAALALVPSNVDVCIPLHLDERLQPGWREALEAGWTPGATKAFYTYQFSPDLVFMQNRIHARSGYRWKYPAHEGVYPYLIQERSVGIPDLRIVQNQDRKKDRSNTLGLLRLGVEENPSDSRMAHYYGRELMYRGRFAEALVYLERYATLPGPVFLVEREQNARHMAYCYGQLARG